MIIAALVIETVFIFFSLTQITYDPNTIPNALINKEKYDKMINICVNYKLKKKYGLMACT